MRKNFRIDQVYRKSPFFLSSRVHKLNAFPSHCYIKREDELAFDAKTRKYSSLASFLLQRGIKNALVIGSPYSNNVLAALQILRQMQIRPIPFLLKPHSNDIQGNLLLSTLFTKLEDIHWIDRRSWPKVQSKAEKLAQSQMQTIVIPEGAFMKEALIGAATLGSDILQNEANSGVSFDHIFLSAGTGMTAFSLLLYFSAIQKKVQLHIVSMAEEKQGLLKKLEKCRSFWNDLGLPEISSLTPYHIIRPESNASFGSIGPGLFRFIHTFAKEEGILLDPIYNAKLFLEGKKQIKKQRLKGNILFVHSGGQMTLSGFQTVLAKQLEQHRR